MPRIRPQFAWSFLRFPKKSSSTTAACPKATGPTTPSRLSRQQNRTLTTEARRKAESETIPGGLREISLFVFFLFFRLRHLPRAERGARAQLVRHAGWCLRNRCDHPDANLHRPLRMDSSAGERGISRTDLRNLANR